MGFQGPPRRITGLLAKRPRPGAVKTRLVGELTAVEAARLQAGMLDDAVERLVAGASGWRAQLAFAPVDERAWFEERYGERRPEVELVAQRGAGLGERLARWFADACSESESVVVTGSDLPLLSLAALDEAHVALAAGADLVLAPDEGGGYGLVGLARPAPALFLEVEMSTPDMGAATVALARRLGLEVALLDPVLDVDDADDLARLVTRLAGTPYPPHTAATRRALAELGRTRATDPTRP